MMRVTVAELLDAIHDAMARAGGNQDGYATTVEIAAAAGVCTRTALKRLAMLHAQGRIESSRVPRLGLDGRFTSSPAYRVRSPAVAPAIRKSAKHA